MVLIVAPRKLTETAPSHTTPSAVAASSHTVTFQHLTPPIHQLPVELLSMVFECLAQVDGIYVSHSVDIMLVCKHWTAVALNTSALWQTIPERARVGWFAIAFARSKNRPVDIVTNPTSLLSVAPLLVKEAHRLRTLDVLPRDTDVDGTDSDVASLLEDTIFAVARFPRLETLIMEK